MLSQSIPQVFSACVSMISVLIAMFATNIYLTLVVLAMVVLMIFVSRYLGGNSSRFFVKQQEDIGKVNGYIEEMMEGQKVVKVFNYEEESKKKFDDLNEQLCDSMTKANMYANILMPCIMNIGNLGYVLVAVIGGILSVNGILTIGSIAAFLQYVKAFTNPLGQVSQQMNSIVMALAGAERIFELLDEEVEQDEGYVTLVNAKIENGKIVEAKERTGIWAWKHPHQDGRITYTRLRGQVEFENVQFGYEEHKRILHDISLVAKEGQKVSFVGATGAGKSSILNLIGRYYDIQKGNIYIDGVDIRKLSKKQLRSAIGQMQQDVFIFEGDIESNIRLHDDIPFEDVRAAAEYVNASHFIEKLPQKYKEPVTERGATFSAGERQLLSFARTLAHKPAILVMDEATANIDTETEILIQEALEKLMKGRTTIMVAHRLSTIQHADCIMVMHKGKIRERGTHQELLAQNGIYKKLYELQIHHVISS